MGRGLLPGSRTDCFFYLKYGGNYVVVSASETGVDGSCLLPMPEQIDQKTTELGLEGGPDETVFFIILASYDENNPQSMYTLSCQTWKDSDPAFENEVENVNFVTFTYALPAAATDAPTDAPTSDECLQKPNVTKIEEGATNILQDGARVWVEGFFPGSRTDCVFALKYGGNYHLITSTLLELETGNGCLLPTTTQINQKSAHLGFEEGPDSSTFFIFISSYDKDNPQSRHKRSCQSLTDSGNWFNGVENVNFVTFAYSLPDSPTNAPTAKEYEECPSESKVQIWSVNPNMGALPAFAETTVYVDARIRPLASVYAECAFLIKGSSGGGVRRRLNSENYHYFDYSQIKPEDEDNDKYSCTLPTGDSLSNAASDRGISFDGDIYITLRAWNSALGESGDSMSCHSLEYYGDIASGVEGQHYVVYKGGTSDQSCPAESKPKLYEVSPASGRFQQLQEMAKSC